MSLQDYINDTQYLIRDTSAMMVPVPQLIRWINTSRRQVAYITGCLRFLVSGASAFGASAQPGAFMPGAAQPGALPNSAPGAVTNQTLNTFTTLPGVELYSFQLAKPFLQAQYAGVDSFTDINNISVSWGSQRPSMVYMPWEDLQAYARAYNIGVFSYPFYWSANGDGANAQAWLFPAPQNAMEMEWDGFCRPSPLYTNSDYEAIPHPWQDAVKYGAAGMCYLMSQRFGFATLMGNLFMNSLGIGRGASEHGKSGNPYWMFQLPG